MTAGNKRSKQVWISRRRRWTGATAVLLATALWGSVSGCGRVVAPPPPPTPGSAEEGPMLPLATDFKAESEENGPSSPQAAPSEVDIPTSGILAEGEADKLLPPGAPPKVELLEAGAAPRAAMRYAVKGSKTKPEKLDMTMSMTITAAALGSGKMRQPPVALRFEAKADAPLERGDVPVQVRVLSAGVDGSAKIEPQVAKALNQALAGLSNMVIAYELTPSGMHRNVAIQIGQNTDQMQAQVAAGVAQAYRATATPLPDEEIGVGARWRVISRHAEGGADLVQISLYELKESASGKLSIDIQTHQLAASSDIAAPGMPPGIATRIVEMKAGGNANQKVDLARATPLAGQSEVRSRMDVEVSKAGQPPARSVVEQELDIQFGMPTSDS